jgi:hypothetical protein
MSRSEAVTVKSLDSPDEARTFDRGKIEIANIEGFTVGRLTLEPGWSWSKDVKSLAKTPLCLVRHTGYCVSGHMKVVHDDGTVQEITAGDMYVIRPGHDAWIVGEETFVGIDLSSATQQFAKEDPLFFQLPEPDDPNEA